VEKKFEVLLSKTRACYKRYGAVTLAYRGLVRKVCYSAGPVVVAGVAVKLDS
jgi:hypothetical protein